MQVVYCTSVTVAAIGAPRPGLCVGKADVSEAAGSPALSFPGREGTRTLILQPASHNSACADINLVSAFSAQLFQVKV